MARSLADVIDAPVTQDEVTGAHDVVTVEQDNKAELIQSYRDSYNTDEANCDSVVYEDVWSIHKTVVDANRTMMTTTVS